ncbi:MAG: DbpA RNA binding domain-containing protein, partial [Candidatus Mariimomonas ferrooxydans]
GKLPSRTEVQEARERELARDLEAVIKEGKHQQLYPLVESLFAKFTPKDKTAAALRLVSGDLEIEHIEETGGPRYSNRADMRRLFLTIGKKDKIRVGDMVRTISEKSGIPGRNIGNIALFDKYSFVEVPADLAEQVIGSINDMIIGGRKVKVQTARAKKRS